MLPHVNEKTEEFEEIEFAYDVGKHKKVSWKDRLLLNRPLKVVTTFILLAVVAPVLIYRFLFIANVDLPPSDGLSFGSCLISREARLPCGYGDVPANECHSECCYDHTNDACFHRFPSRFSYILNEEWSNRSLLTPRIATVPYGSQPSYTNIRLKIDEVSATHLSLNFYKSDPELEADAEYESDEKNEQGEQDQQDEQDKQESEIHGRKFEEKNYTYNVSQGELNIIVNSSQGIIFNTARGPFIASDDIWEMTFKITDEAMYGLGEIPLQEDTVKVIYSHKGGLSSIPLIFAKSNGAYHGLLIDTVAPTEIQIRTENQIIVRSITRLGLKFHLFVGPEPADVMKDVIQLIGANKKLEYWTLGTHICSEPASEEPLADLRTFIDTASTQNMTFESHCGVAPVVFDSEVDAEHVTLVNAGATALRNAGKKFVPHVSPYIRYTAPYIPDDETTTDTPSDEDGEGATIKSNTEEEIEESFEEEENNEHIIRDPQSEDFYIGVVDGYDVIYPRYDNVTEEFMKELWVYSDFDGVILENNWPLDESQTFANETHLFLPYFNENFQAAFEETPLWNATRPERYLYTHNEYGNQFAAAFEMIKADIPTLSTSQWMNTEVTVSRQGVETSWSSLQKELVEASLGGISGHWYWASPICGDTEDFNTTIHNRLCAKWYMAATYMPIIKIHSKEVRRDPLAFVGTDRAHMITALRRRMSLMPYFYTVLQDGPLLRPMFYQYPYVEQLADLKTQFSVGDNLLIVPNLQPSQSHVHFWMPPGQWYEFWSGLKVEGELAEAITMTTTEADFLTLVRGGSIIAIQEEVRLTTALTRKISAFTVIVALHCETGNVTEEVEDDTITTVEPEMEVEVNIAAADTTSTTTEATTTAIPTATTCSAKGKLYMTPEITIHLEADAEYLTIRAEGDDFQVFCDFIHGTWSEALGYISVYGLDDDKNNYDNHLNLDTNINLCELQNNEEITYPFF